jgi:hypothetical protein
MSRILEKIYVVPYPDSKVNLSTEKSHVSFKGNLNNKSLGTLKGFSLKGFV